MVDFALYNHLDHGYAATIHKAQGVTVDRSYLLGSKYLDAHASYVGMTRHRESVDLFYSQEEFPNYIDLVKSLSRERAKDVSLDYLGDFKVNQDIQSSLSKQLLQVPLVKAVFPFNKQYSNLAEFKESNTVGVFEQFKAELEQKFGHIERANDLNQEKLLKEKELEQSFAREQLQFIKNQNRLSEKILNEHNPQKTYKVIDRQETIMGLVGKELNLSDGRRMIEILKHKNDPCINLVEHNQHLIKEQNRYVELKTDHQGSMVDLKDTETLLKEIETHQRAPNNYLEWHVEFSRDPRDQDLSRGFDRGFER
jgi:ATP-dependent exoDNAse (exonuclease V) alpha subunit